MLAELFPLRPCEKPKLRTKSLMKRLGQAAAFLAALFMFSWLGRYQIVLSPVALVLPILVIGLVLNVVWALTDLAMLGIDSLSRTSMD